MANPLPSSTGQVIDLGTKIDNGLVLYIDDLKTTKVTVAGYQSQLADFIGKDNSYNAARSDRQAVSDLFQTAMDNVADWLQVTKGVLTGRFGNRYSMEWAQAGWIDSNLQLPANSGARLALALRLVGFFSNNLNYQVASMNVTVGHGTGLRDAAIAAQNNLMAADAALKTAGEARQTAYDTLTTSMRDVIGLVGRAFGPSDPRWLAFGLNMPSTNTTPGKPVNVTAHWDGKYVVTECNAVPLAARYRWRMLRVGIDTAYELAARSVDPMGLIRTAKPGETLRIIVQAVNGGSQGVASEPIEFTVPIVNATAAAPAATATPVLEMAPVVMPITAGNGRNGHSNGAVSRA